MKKTENRFMRAALGLMALGMYFTSPGKRKVRTHEMHERKVYKMVNVQNTVTGKVVSVPEHNVDYFLRRRTDRWRVQA